MDHYFDHNLEGYVKERQSHFLDEAQQERLKGPIEATRTKRSNPAWWQRLDQWPIKLNQLLAGQKAKHFSAGQPNPFVSTAMNGLKKVNRFKILNQLTGLSTILTGEIQSYRAYDPLTEQEVSLLVTSYPFLVEHLKYNMRVLASLHHANLPPVVGFGQDGPLFYVATLLDHSKNLKEILDQPFELKEASYILSALASALTYLHQQNLIHGYLTPGNISLGDSVLLNNAGLAHLVAKAEEHWSSEDDIEMRSLLVPDGFYLYMSLDAVLGLPLTRQSDQYQLGLIGYMLVTGVPPFHSTNVFEVLSGHLTLPVPDPCQINPALPSTIGPVLQRAMAKTPQERFASVSDFARAFEQAIL